MSWVVDSPELVAVHLLSFICHPWCSSCSMDNHNNQSPGLQLLIITVHSSKNLIILHYNGTVRLLIRHIWQNFFLVKNLLEWFLSLFISISWCPTVLLIITLLHCNKLVYHTKYFSAMHKIFFLQILGKKIIGKVFLYIFSLTLSAKPSWPSLDWAMWGKRISLNTGQGTHILCQHLLSEPN